MSLSKSERAALYKSLQSITVTPEQLAKMRVIEGPTLEPEFRHKLRWDRLGRQGKKCQILRNRGAECQVQFEDGVTAILPRRALTRVE